MEKSARDRHQRKVKSNEFVSSEMRKQILRLQDKLGECESGISRHSNEIEEIQGALTIAQECVQCLLSEDPFEAWKDYAQQKEEEDNAIFSELEDCARPSEKANKKKLRKTHPAKGRVTKLITPDMRQRIHELKSQLDEYAACVQQTLHDLEPESLGTALELSYSLPGDALESPEARRRREEEREDEDEELLDSL